MRKVAFLAKSGQEAEVAEFIHELRGFVARVFRTADVTNQCFSPHIAVLSWRREYNGNA